MTCLVCGRVVLWLTHVRKYCTAHCKAIAEEMRAAAKDVKLP